MKRTLFGFIAGLAAAIICFSVGCTIYPPNPGMAVDLTTTNMDAGTESPVYTATPVPPQEQEALSVPINAQQLSVGREDISSSIQTASQKPQTTVSVTPDPTATPIPTQKSTPTSTPAPTATPKPLATASPSPKPEVKTETVVSIGAASSEHSTGTQDESLTTATNTEQTDEMTAISADYISEVMRAINDARASEGNSTVSLDSGFNDLAAAHAKEMAEAGRMYHSKYRMIESVGKGTVGGMEPYSTGAYSAYHAPQIARDATVTRVGIGGLIKDGTLYICIVAE